jgi:hypothetical protein
MVDLVDRLERKLRKHLIASLPQALASDGKRSLSDLLIDYRIWRGRFISPRPRTVHRARDFAVPPKHVAGLEALEDKMRRGELLTPHLSRAVKSQGKDLLLADWDIHHLHLSDELESDGYVKRDDEVLFAIFDDANAYLIGIHRHPKHANWAAEDIFANMIRNWPNAGLAHCAEWVIGLSQHPSDEERLRLRTAGVNALLEVDGKVYSPRGFGLTTAGTPMQATRQVNALMWQLRQWREDPYERLRQVPNASPDTYWVPWINIALAGFDESCGFLGGGQFVPVGSVCE